uniref:Threonylcarbamoyl-AMP synthase n=1 Tax=Oncorhynchus tshawytscha TaxID=74940 RepID=A0A8C8CNS1_ONCTS
GSREAQQSKALQSLVRIQPKSHPAVIGSPIGRRTIGPGLAECRWCRSPEFNSEGSKGWASCGCANGHNIWAGLLGSEFQCHQKGDLLPGPVTLILERAEVLNTDLNIFTPLVVVCIPDQAFMRRLCQMCREPLALTSANMSSHSSTEAVHEFQDLWPQLSVVVDGGPIGDKSRVGSTGKYRIIRPGCAFSSTVHVLEHKYGLSEDTG